MLDYIKLSNGQIIEYGQVTHSPTVATCTTCGYDILLGESAIEDQCGNVFCSRSCHKIYIDIENLDVDVETDWSNEIEMEMID